MTNWVMIQTKKEKTPIKCL